jgi:dihydroorotate dehydrogenase
LKPALFQFDPELVHDVFVNLGEKLGQSSTTKFLVEKIYGLPEGLEPTTVDGITYLTPVMLAAGFDYNGRLAPILKSVGFGGEEVGSVTARPCPGNHPPRLRRLIKSQSIVVYKGLKNEGVDKIIERLKKSPIPHDFVLGISIAKTNDEKCVTVADGIDDYFYSYQRLIEENIGRFYTINISCPNAHGGEDFTDPDRLHLLLEKLNTLPCPRPRYVKLPINMPFVQLKPLLDCIKSHQFNGVVIGNLNKNYQAIKDESERPQKFRGGLSGLACRDLSNQLISQTREYIPDQFTIIGCGGILTPQDAIEKLNRGANLLQLISGMIFNGPHLMGQIAEALKVRT